MVAQVQHSAQDVQHDIEHLLQEHRTFRAFLTKLGKDNIGMLAAFLSWSILTSMVPIVVGLVAITGFIVGNAGIQAQVITHLHQALQGALSKQEISNIVRSSTQHSGLLGIIGLLGIFWGGSNVGGSFSTAFQAIFEVPGRSFIKEKLIDIGMIFVFTALMLIILAATAAGSLLNRLFANFPLPGVTQFIIGTAIALFAAFLLFAAIYLVFPNIKPPFRFANVWGGAIVSAILFEILSYIWPIYASFSHFSRYGAVLFPILVLTAWIYFFSMITMVGAEIVAINAIEAAQREGTTVGPQPQGSVPQHKVLRQGGTESPTKGGKGSPQQSKKGGKSPEPSQSGQAATQLAGDGQVERDPAFWLLAATPLVVATLAGAYEFLSGKRAT